MAVGVTAWSWANSSDEGVIQCPWTSDMCFPGERCIGVDKAQGRLKPPMMEPTGVREYLGVGVRRWRV